MSSIIKQLLTRPTATIISPLNDYDRYVKTFYISVLLYIELRAVEWRSISQKTARQQIPVMCTTESSLHRGHGFKAYRSEIEFH